MPHATSTKRSKPMSNNNQKCVRITFVGTPNAGKSTLMNRLVGAKVSIVTPKVQTTRTRVTGIKTVGETQIIYLDTPGIFKPNKMLDKSMVKAAWEGLKDTDFTALLVDVQKGIGDEVKMIIAGINSRQNKNILVLNKIDLIAREKLLDITREINEMANFEATFMISALKGNGVEDLEKYFTQNAPEGQWIYPEDQMTDLPSRMFAAEITREKLMLCLNKEIPYNLMVETEQWEEKPVSKKYPNGSANIRQVIYVTSESQKKIVVGKAGSNIKKVGEMARKELEWALEMKINLFLFVKVQENWLTNPEHYRMMGLD